MKSSLSNCWQRARVNTSFSSWSEFLIRVTLGSVLELLFATFHACDSDIESLINGFEDDSLLSLNEPKAISSYVKLKKTADHP